jgi:hypothetical protein
MNKRYYTLDDLYKFYENKNETCHFSVDETGYPLSVQLPAQFEINEEQNDNSLLFCKVKLMHSGENRNHSSVTDDALDKAAKCLAYKPILANFMEYEDKDSGEILKDFTSHDMELNNDGSIEYIEKQVGCFTFDEPYFETEEDTGHRFLYGYCAIPRVYTDAASIIERKKGTKISVELSVNEAAYDVNTKILELRDVVIMGATLLGKNPVTKENVEEGMKNARVDIADFSTENNSVKFDKDEKIIELLEKINTNISVFNNSTKEGGEQKEMSKFEELLQKYNKTIEDITFEYADMTDDELEAKFEECFAENTKDPVVNGSKSVVVENLVRSFEISHDDIRYGLYTLLQTVEDDDDTWYWISDVYDTYFIYESYGVEKIFKQGYKVEDDVISFDGERIELFRELLTAKEKAELENMRKNYSALKEFKENTEKNVLHAKREELVNSDKYTILADKDENGVYKNTAFAELIEKMDEYSLEELETKIKVMHSDYVSEHSNFAHQEDSKKSKTIFFANSNSNSESKEKVPYGGIFEGYKN